jgi:hypothetical protein
VLAQIWFYFNELRVTKATWKEQIMGWSRYYLCIFSEWIRPRISWQTRSSARDSSWAVPKYMYRAFLIHHSARTLKICLEIMNNITLRPKEQLTEYSYKVHRHSFPVEAFLSMPVTVLRTNVFPRVTACIQCLHEHYVPRYKKRTTIYIFTANLWYESGSACHVGITVT